MKKESYIKFRCTELEKLAIKNKAENRGLSISSYCRLSSLNQKTSYKLTEEELEVYKDLTKYHNDLQKIGNYLKSSHPNLVDDIRKLTLEIKNHLKKMK